MAKKKTEFPIEIRSGSVVVKINAVNKPDGRKYFQIRYYDGSGKRKTLSRSDLDKAKADAQRIATDIHNGSVQGAPLSASDRLAFERASAVAKDIALPIDSILAEYRRCFDRMPSGSSLIDAVDFYVRHSAAAVESKEVAAVAEEWKAQLASDGKSERYREDVSHRLSKFTATFSEPLDQLTTKQLQTWLNGLDLAGRSRNNVRATLVSLFRYARDQGYLPPDMRTAADALKKATENSAEIGILTVATMVELLKAADDRLRLYLAIGGFSGLRSSELLALDWSEIDFGQKHIEVTSGKAKTRQRRIVPLHSNLLAWIKNGRKEKGPVFPNEEVLADRRELVAKLKLKWPNNALRHSYASYRMAVLKDANELAHEMGNSPQMIYRNYRSVVKPSEAKKWFGIVPKSRG